MIPALGTQKGDQVFREIPALGAGSTSRETPALGPRHDPERYRCIGRHRRLALHATSDRVLGLPPDASTISGIIPDSMGASA